jgi:hypothetical protein
MVSIYVQRKIEIKFSSYFCWFLVTVIILLYLLLMLVGRFLVHNIGCHSILQFQSLLLPQSHIPSSHYFLYKM